VDSLLNDSISGATAFVDVTDYKCPEYFDGVYENNCSTIAHHQQFAQSRFIHVLFNIILNYISILFR